MKNFVSAVNNSIFANLLPKYGTPCTATCPVYDAGRNMFLCDQYENASGNRYYRGVRFCPRLAIVEKVGEYHNWTYLDGIEIYTFEGKNTKLVGKRDFDKQFRDTDFVRETAQSMVQDYLRSALKMNGKACPDEDVASVAGTLVDQCFVSLLDKDFPMHLMQALPALEHKE